MSLFQCENCGCCENTALTAQGHKPPPEWFDWTGMEHLKGRHLCSACAPKKYSDGVATRDGQWHGQFDRVFLPMGMFRTAKNGNLEHIETGDEDFRKYELPNPNYCRRLQDENLDEK